MEDQAILHTHNTNNQRIKSDTEPFTMIWRDIFYEVQTTLKDKNNQFIRKAIINNVSGYAISGEVTAIMGPSGCGKTSLLNYLNNRIQFPSKSVNKGEIFINSDRTTVSQIAELSSYVMQDDLLFDILTPRETLMFVSKLRRYLTQQEYEKEVDNLMEELKLTKCKDTRVGNASRKGISGGERKRVSIGVEIISNPSILFLDEPTSGLDSQTSFIVIDFLKGLAQSKNMIVIFTIHQPSSNIFSLFDRLILLNKGQGVYQGATLGVIPYFAKIGFPLGEKSNPADALMHIMENQTARLDRKAKNDLEMMDKKDNLENNNHLKSESQVGVELPLTEVYKENSKPQINQEINSILNKGEHSHLKYKEKESVGFCRQFSILSLRAFLNLIRNPLTLRIRLIMVLVFSFIACSIFYNMQNNVTGIYNKSGFFFFFTINNFMTTLFGAVLAFPMERGVFLREYSSKLYGIVPYYLSKNMIETPISLFVAFLYAVIVYYIVGLRPEVQHYFIFICIYVCLVWLSQSMGLCFGASFSNLNTALVITQFSILPAFLFSGFLINQENMPAWLAWIRFLSPFRYCLEAAMRNEFDGNPNVPQNLSPVDTLNLDIGMWNCVGIMVAFGFGLRVLGLMFLKLLVRKVG
jgi:ABC-type multidrug transport system ATPase subunit